jgi:hypothetical protein
MLADQVGRGRAIDAIDLVVGDIAMDPLNLGAEVCDAPFRSAALAPPIPGMSRSMTNCGMAILPLTARGCTFAKARDRKNAPSLSISAMPVRRL